MTNDDYLQTLNCFEEQLNKMRRLHALIQTETFKKTFAQCGGEVIADLVSGNERAVKEWLKDNSPLEDLTLKDLRERARQHRIPTFNRTRLELLQILKRRIGEPK